MSRQTLVSRKKRGIGVVEVLVGVSIVSLVLVFSMYAIARFVNTGKDVADKTQALYLAEEALELVRFVRDNSWSNISSLTNDTTYYLDVDSSSVSITTTPEDIEGFERSFRVTDVYRDTSDDDIVASTTGGSAADSSSKYVTAYVSWGTISSTTVSLVTILTDIE